MKILVCFKPLPCWERVLEDDWEGFSLNTELAYAGTAFNCFDEAAFELALRLKEQAGEGASCTAVTVGGRPAAPLTESLYAGGFDEVIVLRDEAGDFSPRQVALRLSDFTREGGFDLILTGTDSGTAGTGTVPFLLAELLELPLLTNVRELSLEERSSVSAISEDNNGLWQRCVGLPVAVSVGNSPAVFRAVSLRARLKAKGRKPEIIEAKTPSEKPNPILFRPKTGRSCTFLTASPEDLAKELLSRHFVEAAGAKSAPAPEFPALPKGLKAVGYAEPASLGSARADWKIRRPELTLLPDTAWGRRLAVHLANRENCSFLTGVTLRGFVQNGVRVQKKVCAANLVWTETLAFPAALTLTGKLPEALTIVGIPGGNTVESGSLLWEKQLEAPVPGGLSNPGLVIVCGVGMGSRKSCDEARKLARRLGAGFGLTRPAALNGWGGPEEIVGQSGELIAPGLCLVLGASGAGAFAVGIEGAGRVIAVNTDKNALIFRHADMGVIQDAAALVDAILEKL